MASSMTIDKCLLLNPRKTSGPQKPALEQRNIFNKRKIFLFCNYPKCFKTYILIIKHLKDLYIENIRDVTEPLQKK